jgi:hypothetical protein
MALFRRLASNSALAPFRRPVARANTANLVPPEPPSEGDPCPRQPATNLPTDAPKEVLATPWDIVDEWGTQSFPASDPPANW